MKIVLYLVVLFNLIGSLFAINCKGCVPLDSFTFDKIISKFDVALIKFDVSYPYGAKHDEFALVSEASHTIPELLIGEVGIKDYGEKENSDLAQRYGVGKEQFPVVKLFMKGKDKPETFANTEFTAENLKKFVRIKSGLHISLPGCLPSFDQLATRFKKANDVETRKSILNEAEDLWEKTMGPIDSKKAEIYVKMMRKVLEKGDEFVENEIKRVSSLTKGKVSNEKKMELDQRVNILQSFSHDEL